jgi:hypothetical protein
LNSPNITSSILLPVSINAVAIIASADISSLRQKRFTCGALHYSA